MLKLTEWSLSDLWEAGALLWDHTYIFNSTSSDLTSEQPCNNTLYIIPSLELWALSNASRSLRKNCINGCRPLPDTCPMQAHAVCHIIRTSLMAMRSTSSELKQAFSRSASVLTDVV